MDKEMDELNAVLMTRYVPPVTSDLASRIIALSHGVEQMPSGIVYGGKKHRGFGLGGWLSGVFDSLMLPRPVYALSMALVLGVLIGAYTDLSSSITVQDDVTSLIALNDDAGYGDWL